VDVATIVGVLAGFVCVFTAVAGGGDPRAFVHLPSMAITIGGMISATLIHFSLAQVLGILSVVKKTISYKMPAEHELIQKIVNYSAINRRDGALALEGQIGTAGDEFLSKALQMVVDGQSEQAVEKQLGMEIQYLQERHADGKKVLEFMGASAPAWGMIGTLIGLVQMLGKLEDPSQIGLGMATALITTFYGALMANLVFIPLAGKLGTRSKRETMLREMIVEGVLAIVRGENPMAVREKIQAFISAKQREGFKAKG
jgi:chemotaxis protein MotA